MKYDILIQFTTFLRSFKVTERTIVALFMGSYGLLWVLLAQEEHHSKNWEGAGATAYPASLYSPASRPACLPAVVAAAPIKKNLEKWQLFVRRSSVCFVTGSRSQAIRSLSTEF